MMFPRICTLQIYSQIQNYIFNLRVYAVNYEQLTSDILRTQNIPHLPSVL